jgi:hypothetical protein
MGLLDSLVSYWSLDEASGTRNDSHGTNHLTDNNTVTQADGKLNKAGQFVAANSEYLSHASNASLQTGDIDFAFSLWVYLDAIGTRCDLVWRYDGGSPTPGEYGLFYTDPGGGFRFRFAVYNSAGGALAAVSANTLGVPSALTWYHIVAWHDKTAKSANIQINNGGVDTTTYSSGAIGTTNSNFMVGKTGDIAGNYWNGRIDSLGFWKKVLSSDERAALYNGGLGAEYPWGPKPRVLIPNSIQIPIHHLGL